MISLEKLKILTPLQKLLKNVGDLDKLIVAKGFEKLPKSNKSPNLVTLKVPNWCVCVWLKDQVCPYRLKAEMIGFRYETIIGRAVVGFGIVGKTVPCDSRDRRFISSLWQFLFTVNCI